MPVVPGRAVLGKERRANTKAVSAEEEAHALVAPLPAGLAGGARGGEAVFAAAGVVVDTSRRTETGVVIDAELVSVI
jgi:hypothetical protein